MKSLRLLVFTLALVLVLTLEPRRELQSEFSSCQLCAECIASGQQENTQCQRICGACDRRSAWPIPSRSPGAITTSCGLCTQYPRPSPECMCCGSNLCSDYYLGIATPLDPFYAQLRDIARFLSSCEYGPNFGCPTCALWRKINNFGTTPREFCDGTPNQCWVVHELRHTFLAANNITDRRHYLMLPGSVNFRWPIIGIEDMQVLHMEETWAVAYQVALRPYENLPLPYQSISTLPVSSMTSDIGIALNPACTRSQHQMHIHVEPVPISFREILRGGRNGAFRVWTRITLNTLIGSVTLLVKYFPLRNPATARPFETVFNLAGRDFTNLRAWGIIIIPDEERIPAERGRPFPPGFYFVTGAFNSEQPPSFNRYPPNENFEPENLLCNCYSSGESAVFWSSNNCPTLQCPSTPRFLSRLGEMRGNPQPWTDSLFPSTADDGDDDTFPMSFDNSSSTTVESPADAPTAKGGHN